MKDDAQARLLAALAALADALRALRHPAMVIGGIAVIARGVSRLTADIDATIRADGLALDHALEIFAQHSIEPRIDEPLKFAQAQQILLLRHVPSGALLDVSLAWLPFEHEALERATDVDFHGVSIPVAQPDDLIVLKAVAWRPRDRDDIDQLVLRYGRTLNLARIRDLVGQFAEVLEVPERPREFEALVGAALAKSQP